MVERLLWEQEVARSNRVAPIGRKAASTPARHHPPLPITHLAQCMANVNTDVDTTRRHLQHIHVDAVGIPSAVGPFGRTQLRLGVQDAGRQMLQRTIEQGVATHVDHVSLANRLLQLGEPKPAFEALGERGRNAKK